MTAQILMLTGCFIMGFLGAIHLIYTMGTNKLDPYDEQVTFAMKATSPVINKHTSIWNSWLGFNYSHSFGLLWVPAVYLPLVFNHMLFLYQSLWLSLLPAIMALVYAVLSKKYWFTIPFAGSAIAFVCFTTSFYLMHLM